MNPIYEKLRAKLDTLGTGFPKTEGGAEYELLQNRFSVEDAEYAVELKADWESPADLAGRMGKDVAVVSEKLLDMSHRGLIYRKRIDGDAFYKVMPWILGIMEYQVNRGGAEAEFRAVQNKYFAGGYGRTMWGNETPLLRYMPVNAELVNENKLLLCDDARAIIDSKQKVAVMNCICRQGTLARGDHCEHVNHPIETCLACDTWAEFFVENGDARYITKDKAKDLLSRAEAEGLLIMTANSESADTICMCCSCCCGPLRLLKRTVGHARNYAGNYLCIKNEELCVNCGKCAERCLVSAHVKDENGNVKYDPSLCVGCGLCISTCPSKALSLEIKERDQRNVPYGTLDELQDALAEQRLGKH